MHLQDSPPRHDRLISFRDPSGRLLDVAGRILRVVKRSMLPDVHAYLASPKAQCFVEAGRVVHTKVLDSAELKDLTATVDVPAMVGGVPVGMILEHERIRFPSYPYEWAPEMLYRAGHLTLDLAQQLLTDGLGLKDATPYNVLFRGSDPVFIDILSFERRDPKDPTWTPYAQFVRTFLLPLLVNKHFDLPLQQVFLSRRDGLEPEEVYRFCRALQKLRPRFLTLVTLPTLLAAKSWKAESQIYRKRSVSDPEKARFILDHVLNHLRRVLTALEPTGDKSSPWARYMTSDHSYSETDFQTKHAFVEKMLKEFRPARVLDVGCNTGHFSDLAAAEGADVVAIDSDPGVVSRVYRDARTKALKILPLVVDLTRSSPAIGWRNRECAAFLERARGAFDAVFMLAVIHHMLVTERIPLSEIVSLSAELTNDLLVIEFVAPDDPMFRHLARGRDSLFSDLTQGLFESTCNRYYEIVRSQALGSGSRRLYLMRKKRLATDA